MDDNLEQLVLSGALFSNAGDTASPPRSPGSSRAGSPSRADTDAVLFAPGGDDSEEEYGGTHVPSSSKAKKAEEAHESIGLGPGRTGVKGVIRDRNEARERDSERKAKENEEVTERLKRMDLSARTYFDDAEEEERRLKAMGLEKPKREGDAWKSLESWKKKRTLDFRSGEKRGGGGYGHLREVGASGYVDAVENVPPGVWVVVHIYDASLPRCAILDSHLSSLARKHPSAKFLRVRAAAIGFAASTTSKAWGSTGNQSNRLSRTKVTSTSKRKGKYVDPDESEDEDEEDEYQDGHSDDEVEPDCDMLPTMLVYRRGELVYNWVRVDWDIGAGGGQEELEALLSKHHIIPPVSSLRRVGNLSEDEDDEVLEFALDVE